MAKPKFLVFKVDRMNTISRCPKYEGCIDSATSLEDAQQKLCDAEPESWDAGHETVYFIVPGVIVPPETSNNLNTPFGLFG